MRPHNINRNMIASNFRESKLSHLNANQNNEPTSRGSSVLSDRSLYHRSKWQFRFQFVLGLYALLRSEDSLEK